MRLSYGLNVDLPRHDRRLASRCAPSSAGRLSLRAARSRGRSSGSGGNVLARRRSGRMSRRRRNDRPGGGPAPVGRLPGEPRPEPCRPGASHYAAEAPQGGRAQGQGRRVVRAAQPTPCGAEPTEALRRAGYGYAWFGENLWLGTWGQFSPRQVVRAGSPPLLTARTSSAPDSRTSASPAYAPNGSSASPARRSGSRRSRARSAPVTTSRKDSSRGS